MIQLQPNVLQFIGWVVEISNGYQFLSKKDYHELLNQLIIHKEKKKLSTAAMETLAIIAYKQPITKSEIELIRGVNCDYSVQKLLEKDFIKHIENNKFVPLWNPHTDDNIVAFW